MSNPKKPKPSRLRETVRPGRRARPSGVARASRPKPKAEPRAEGDASPTRAALSLPPNPLPAIAPPPDAPPSNPIDPTKPNETGVYAERKRRWGLADLRDPRDPPWEDLVAAQRRRLLDGQALPREPLGHLLGPQQENIAVAVYRYSKGPDFTNDEMGYGERVIETMWHVVDGKLTAVSRTSQRTKTGRQLLPTPVLGPRNS